ncbi:MAG: Adaptive-response sensory-kinase SasA [Desulfovibrio sp.]
MQHSSETDAQLAAEGLDARHAALEERIHQKIADYDHYKFTVRQTRVLNIFFDLAQEYEDLTYLYHLPVDLLQFFFNIKAELYARDGSGEFVVQTPKTGPETKLPDLGTLGRGPCVAGEWCFFPVRGRPGDGVLSRRAEDWISPPHTDEREILAIIAILPETSLTEHERLFYEKFANRLGFSLHNRILALKNLEHIGFVRTLVHDIGHNVIVPNLHFKLLMRQMEGKIAALRQLAEDAEALGEEATFALSDLCGKIESHYEEINKHFHQSSFFLETLLRQSHFDQGRYVLQRTLFPLVTRVVAPQLERYRLRFYERGIAVEERSFGGADTVMVNGDVGLLSQVVANFFSNAVKYTRVTPGITGLKVRCATTLEKDYFGEGLDGIKVAVLSSGEKIPESEAGHLFSESFRASNTAGEEGTGHGLYFSRLIIGQHGGECGYAREPEGNVFYIVLPVSRDC